MKTLSKLICALSLSAIAFLPITQASAGYLESHRSSKSAIKKMKRAKQIPTSMSCKNVSDRMLKPEVKFTSAPNKDARDWFVIAHYDTLDWKPRDKKFWSKKYSKRVKSSKSGRVFNCSLWYGPKGTLGKSKYVNIGASTKTGFVSTQLKN